MGGLIGGGGGKGYVGPPFKLLGGPGPPGPPLPTPMIYFDLSGKYCFLFKLVCAILDRTSGFKP